LFFFIQIVAGIKNNKLITIPAISAALFNLYFEEQTFQAMGIQQISFMAMTLAVFQLIDKGKYMLLACAISWLAIFTQSNDLLIIPFVGAILLEDIYNKRSKFSKNQILLWTVSSIICFIVFFTLKDITAWNKHFIKMSPFSQKTGVSDIVLNFFASMASLPFTKPERIPYAAPIGAIHFAITIIIFLKSWKTNRPLSLMLVFCIVSLLAAALMRTAVSGPIAFVSRYKIYCAVIIAIEIALLSDMINRARWLLILLVFAFCLTAHSYYMNADYIADYKVRREKAVMQWFYYDEISNLPLVNAILDEAYSTKLYSPAIDINYAAIPTRITEEKDCPRPNAQKEVTITLRTVPSSRAALLSVQKPHGVAAPIPDALWLCGPKNYHVIPRRTEDTRHLTSPDGQQMVILEKSLFAEGEYQLMHQSGTEITSTSIKIDMIFSPKQSRDCTRHKDTLLTLFPSLYSRYCKEQTTSP
jgi:hypothetical protein